MAFTSGQVVNAADLNDLDITTITTSGNGTIGGDLTLTASSGNSNVVWSGATGPMGLEISPGGTLESALYYRTSPDAWSFENASGDDILTIDIDDQRVGVLNASPSYSLDVNGTGRFTGDVITDDLTVNCSSTEIITQGSLAGVSYGDRDGSGRFVIYNSGDTLGVWNDTISANVMSFSTSGDISLRSANNVRPSIQRVGGIYFTWDSDSYGTNAEHSIRSTDGDTWSDDITINSFGNVRINIDSNNNGSNNFYIQSHGTGTGNVILYVPDNGNGIYLEQGWFRAPDDNGFYFENHGTGMRSPISEGGTYGSVATYGGENGWEGWSIGGRVVFMHNMSNDWGIYNDVNNEWMILGGLNGDVGLYYNNSRKLVTQSDGTETTGTHTSRRSTTSSNWSYMQFEAATGSTSNSTAGIAGHLPGLMAGVWRVWYGNGEGWDSGNSGGTGYRFVGASSFVTRSSERWKKNIHSRTDDEIIPKAMNLLSCRTAVWDETSLDPVCCEDGESFEEPEMCEDPNCDCDHCAEIRNDPIQRRHFGRRGYIVEELEQVFPDAVFYERDGSPSGIDYSVVTAELIDIVKLLVLQGDENNRRLSALEQS